MKVLVVTNMYPSPALPSFGTFVHDQVEALRAEGVEVDVLSFNGRESKWKYLSAFPRYWRALRGGGYDLVHAHYILAGVVARAQWGHKVVLTHHGPEVLGQPAWQGPLCKLMTPLFDEVIHVTEQVRRHLRDRDGWVIPCGVDLDAFVPLDRDEARARLGLPAGKPLVLFAGDYWRPEKRFDLVEAAMALVKREMPDAELVLLTKQPHDVVPVYMSACDVLVLTSALEGSPMVIKEAMACNLPIVSVVVGDAAEVIGDTPGCAVVARDPAAIATGLIAALHERRRTDGRTRINHLQHDNIARRILAVYERATQPRRIATSRELPRRGWRRSAPSVCIVRHNYYPDSHVRRDAEALVKAGYDVSVIALRGKGQRARETLNGVDVHRLPVERQRGSALRYAWEYSSFALLAFLRLTRLHLRKRFRVVEIDNMPDILVFSALVPWLTGTPVILYIFDNMPELFAYLRQTSERHPLVRLLAFLERISAAFASRVIVTQEMPRRIAVARGVPEEKLSVVLNCADETIFNRNGITDAPTQNGRFEIVSHGVLLERYGIQVLIEALPAVLTRVSDAHLQIFGAGEYRDTLERRVARLGLEAHVHFRGFAPLDELLTELARADAGYVGMLNDLSLPNKLMEYVVMGVPVIISRWPTFTYYFPEDSVTYFDAGDAGDLACALLRIHAGREAARERAARARSRYQHYRWEVQREIYLNVYAELAGIKDERAASLAREAAR
ncbi:MAG TPA: glycosyltransferase [Thermomicrobiales bacterium]|nr:glycosyltransferase [Thermomicrobiales bacterium]